MDAKPNHSSPPVLCSTQSGPCPHWAGRYRAPLAERGVEGGVQLGPVDVDAGPREVREAAGVVEVEVGDDDVVHVRGVVTPGAASCEWAVSEGSSRGPTSVVKARPRRRAPVGDVVDAEPGVDEGEPGVALDEEAVGDQLTCGHQARDAADRRGTSWPQLRWWTRVGTGASWHTGPFRPGRPVRSEPCPPARPGRSMS